jgi:hypothetical protein
MPTDLTIPFTDAERDLLERVRAQQGLESIDQAAEWLAKRGMRQGAKRVTGRGRSLYLVPRERS